MSPASISAFRCLSFATLLFYSIIGSTTAGAIPLPETTDEALPVHRVADINSLFGASKKALPANEQGIQPEIHDDASFEEKAKTYHVLPFNDTRLEFEIRLPADWQADKISLDSAPDLKKLLLGDIARFRSPYIGTYQAFVTVQAQQITREISAKNWLRNYILTSGYALQDDVIETDLRRASAAYIYVQEGVSSYNYITVQINGNTIILARFEAPLALKDYISFLQKKSIDSFNLIYKQDAPIEEQKAFTLVDAIKFSYPQSWDVVSPDFKDMNRISVQLHNKGATGTLDGYINCIAIRRNPDTTFKKEIARLKKDLTSFFGLEFKSLLSSAQYPISDRFLLSQMESYAIAFKKRRQADQEMQILILGDREWYIFMYLLTPTEQDNLNVWARNARAFELITKSIK